MDLKHISQTLRPLKIFEIYKKKGKYQLCHIN